MLGRTLFAARLEEAEQLVRDGMELGTVTGQPDAQWFHLVTLTYIRAEQDRIHEVIDGWEAIVAGRRLQAPGSFGREDDGERFDVPVAGQQGVRVDFD